MFMFLSALPSVGIPVHHRAISLRALTVSWPEFGIPALAKHFHPLRIRSAYPSHHVVNSPSPSTPQSTVNEVQWCPLKGSSEAEELMTSAVQDARLMFWNMLQVRAPALRVCLLASPFATGAVSGACARPRSFLSLHDF
jgi:hypothetical protein